MQDAFGRVVKTSFYVPRALFWEKQFLWKIFFVFFSNLFLKCFKLRLTVEYLTESFELFVETALDLSNLMFWQENDLQVFLNS